MNAPLKEQIRAYFVDLDEQQSDVEVADVMGRVEEGKVVLIDVEDEAPPAVPPRRQWWWAGLVAAAVAVLVIAGLVVFRPDDSEPVELATNGSASESLPEGIAAPDDALAVVFEFVELYNAGDVGGVLELFSSAADRLNGIEGGDTAEFEMLLAWNAGQNTQLVDVDCRDAEPAELSPEVPDPTPGQAVVVCGWGNAPAKTRAVGSDPVQIMATFVVSGAGIDGFYRDIGSPNFVDCCRHFINWVGRNHADRSAVLDVFVWDSPAQARTFGELLAEFADQYLVEQAAVGQPDEASTSDGTSDEGAPTVAQVGEWTRVDGLSIHDVISDGNTFFGFASGEGVTELFSSDDGINWEFVVEVSRLDPHSVAVRDGRLVAVEDGQAAVIVHIVESDGSYRAQEIPFKIPAVYEPFREGSLFPTVNILDDGRLVVHASYSAQPRLVERAAPGLIAERFGVAVDDVEVTTIPDSVGTVEVTVDGATREISVADLGLDPLWERPRPLVAISADGATWTQPTVPADRTLFGPVAASGGLVSNSNPLVFGVPDGLVTSVDGVVWVPVIDPDTGAPVAGVQVRSVQNHAFIRRPVAEITTNGLVALADETTSANLLDSFAYEFGPLTVGNAGIVYTVGNEDGATGISYSLDDGRTWTFDPFPEQQVWGSGLAVGASTIVVIEYKADGDAALWLRELPA